MRKLIPAILLILSLASCEEPQQDSSQQSSCQPPSIALVQPEEVGDIAFRQTPAGIYTWSLDDAPIYRDGFKAIIDHCADEVDPPLTCTFSWYDNPTGGRRVLGLGCSMLGDEALWDCYRWLIEANDGVKF
jgi:hypothetical protein